MPGVETGLVICQNYMELIRRSYGLLVRTAV